MQQKKKLSFKGCKMRSNIKDRTRFQKQTRNISNTRFFRTFCTIILIQRGLFSQSPGENYYLNSSTKGKEVTIIKTQTINFSNMQKFTLQKCTQIQASYRLMGYTGFNGSLFARLTTFGCNVLLYPRTALSIHKKIQKQLSWRSQILPVCSIDFNALSKSVSNFGVISDLKRRKKNCKILSREGEREIRLKKKKKLTTERFIDI